MDFSTLMNVLFDLQGKVSDMDWTIEKDWHVNKIVISFDISDENADLLRQARQMFFDR